MPILLHLFRQPVNNHRQPCLLGVVLFAGGTARDVPICNALCDCSTKNCRLMLLANPGLKSTGWNVYDIKLISRFAEATTTTMTIREATTTTSPATTTTTTMTTTTTTTTTPTISTYLSLHNFPFPLLAIKVFQSDNKLISATPIKDLNSLYLLSSIC